MNYEDLSDEALVSLLKEADDEKALSALYLRYWDKLLVLAANRLDHPEEAEELVQDLFFNVWQRRHSLELRHSFKTYLVVAVKYRIINYLDKQCRLRRKMTFVSFDNEQEPLTHSSEVYYLEKELMERIEASVNQLPEKCRIVFRMSRKNGIANKQIAIDLGISEKTVEAHLSKAIKDIRSNLGVFFFLI